MIYDAIIGFVTILFFLLFKNIYFKDCLKTSILHQFFLNWSFNSLAASLRYIRTSISA